MSTPNTFSWRNKKNIMWIPHLSWNYAMVERKNKNKKQFIFKTVKINAEDIFCYICKIRNTVESQQTISSQQQSFFDIQKCAHLSGSVTWGATGDQEVAVSNPARSGNILS